MEVLIIQNALIYPRLDGSFFFFFFCNVPAHIIEVVDFWSRKNSVLDTAECAKVANNMAVDVYQWLREV